MSKLNVLVIGSGGREHALAWALARSPSVGQIYVAPGNAGTEWPAGDDKAGATNVPIQADDDRGLLAFARERRIDLTVVGPEVPLAMAIVDQFAVYGLPIFGPKRSAAQIEASKSFGKYLMHRLLDIPTAKYGAFDNVEAAERYLADFKHPVVVKADGLAAGKGVIICANLDESLAAVRHMLGDRAFGEAGARVVIEEFLTGPELSVLAFADGRTVVPMPAARDHKRIFDGDQGPNTGGMGANAPVPEIDATLMEQIRRTILQPLIHWMAQSTPYVGVLYAGLMLTPDGPKVLEFNARFGDPETQALLPLLDTDLVEVMLACIEGRLDQIDIRWKPDTCATVVLASPGYPESYPKGLPITGLDRFTGEGDCMVFHAGTARQGDQVVTAGGRVLSVSGLGKDLPSALARVYAGIEQIRFEGMHYRRDIGHLSLKVKHDGQ